MNEILDYNEPDDHDKADLSEIATWWETKRLRYNLLIGICGLLNIFLRKEFDTVLIIPIIIYGIIANLFYCGGIMLEVWDNYYFKGKLRMRSLRPVIFVLGLLISAFVTVTIDTANIS